MQYIKFYLKLINTLVLLILNIIIITFCNLTLHYYFQRKKETVRFSELTNWKLRWTTMIQRCIFVSCSFKMKLIELLGQKTIAFCVQLVFVPHSVNSSSSFLFFSFFFWHYIFFIFNRFFPDLVSPDKYWYL